MFMTAQLLVPHTIVYSHTKCNVSSQHMPVNAMHGDYTLLSVLRVRTHLDADEATASWVGADILN